MLIELALRGRLQLEACGMRRKSLLTRKVRGGLCNIAFLKSLCCLKMKNVSSNSFLFYWSIVDLHCANSCYIVFSYMYTYILFFFFLNFKLSFIEDLTEDCSPGDSLLDRSEVRYIVFYILFHCGLSKDIE